MLVRVQVRANIVTTTPHQYVYVYVCVYMSHISVAVTTDFSAAPAQGKPLYTGLL
jgi:hypothetical protein